MLQSFPRQLQFKVFLKFLENWRPIIAIPVLFDSAQLAEPNPRMLLSSNIDQNLKKFGSYDFQIICTPTDIPLCFQIVKKLGG